MRRLARRLRRTRGCGAPVLRGRDVAPARGDAAAPGRKRSVRERSDRQPARGRNPGGCGAILGPDRLADRRGRRRRPAARPDARARRPACSLFAGRRVGAGGAARGPAGLPCRRSAPAAPPAGRSARTVRSSRERAADRCRCSRPGSPPSVEPGARPKSCAASCASSRNAWPSRRPRGMAARSASGW